MRTSRVFYSCCVDVFYVRRTLHQNSHTRNYKTSTSSMNPKYLRKSVQLFEFLESTFSLESRKHFLKLAIEGERDHASIRVAFKIRTKSYSCLRNRRIRFSARLVPELLRIVPEQFARGRRREVGNSHLLRLHLHVFSYSTEAGAESMLSSRFPFPLRTSPFTYPIPVIFILIFNRLYVFL